MVSPSPVPCEPKKDPRSARASDLYINSLLDKFESINDPLSHEEPTTIVLFGSTW